MIYLLVSLDECGGFGFLCDHPNIFFGGLVLVIPDVFAEGEVKEHGFLADHSELASQVVDVVIPEFDPVDCDGSGFREVESLKELNDGGLSAAGWTHEGDLLPWMNLDVHVFEDVVVPGLVLE